MRTILAVAGLVVFALNSGCTGLTQGENRPGSDTWLEDGSIAVDDRSETAFVAYSSGYGSSETKTLFAIDPDTGTVRPVMNLSGREDSRILFPASGILVMSERNGADRLDLLDTSTFATIHSETLSIRYNGTRMSPSRKWVAVADNTSAHAPIHIIDTATLERTIIPHNGDWLEAMWSTKSDRLAAIVFYDEGTDHPHARVLSWSMQAVRDGGYATDESGCWAARELDIDVPNTESDFAFSYTWVGASPDDRTTVFPVRQVDASGHDSYVLLVMDLVTGELRSVNDAKGPVGFTPDGSTIVSYRENSAGGEDLLLIDAKTLLIDTEPVPIDGGLSYFVSHEGNFIVAASSWGDQRLVLIDLDHGTSSQMAGPGVALGEFVSRMGHKELWLVDSEALYRLDMNEGDFRQVPVSFGPRHINILPSRDRLVLDDADTGKIVYFDPETRSVTRRVTLGAAQ